MLRPAAEALALAGRFRLGGLVVRRGGLAGDRLGRGTGASIEFEDHRVYAAGDDVRNVDWRAFARTDQLLVQLHREEVQPRVDVVLDTSRSMASEPEKAQLAVDLAGLFLACARGESLAARFFTLGDEGRRQPPALLESEGVAFEGRRPLASAVRELREMLTPGARRLVISDFLAPDAELCVPATAERASSQALIQVLGPFEAAPPEGAALRLTDAETGEHDDLVLDGPTLEAYRSRLARLSGEMGAMCRRHAARWVPLVAGPSAALVARETLVPAGLLEPA